MKEHKFRDIAEIENEEFERLKECNEKDLMDAFIMTASEKSIEIWEKEIYIKYDKVNDTLEFRRQRLINRYTIKPPFTIVWLENQLKSLIGDNLLDMRRDDDVETVFIEANFDSYSLLKEFITTLENTVPLSMLWSILYIAYKMTETKLYFGSTNLMHIKIESKPD